MLIINRGRIVVIKFQQKHSISNIGNSLVVDVAQTLCRAEMSGVDMSTLVGASRQLERELARL